jgi:hypothetical protein
MLIVAVHLRVGRVQRMAENNDVAKALGDPVIDEFPDSLQRLRRNLLILSSVTLIYCLGQIKIEKRHPLGIEISGLSEHLVTASLLAWVSYHLVHFL